MSPFESFEKSIEPKTEAAPEVKPEIKHEEAPEAAPEIRRGKTIKEVSLEEGAEILRGRIKEELAEDKEFALLTLTIKQSRDFLLGLTSERMDAVLGKEGVDSALGIISGTRKLLKQMGIGETDLRKFIEENGNEMLPCRIRHVVDRLESAYDFMTISPSFARNIEEQLILDEFWRENSDKLKKSLTDLSEENDNWRSSLSFDRAKEEQPMGVAGFEKFDLPNIKGREIVETAAQILPRGLLSVNTGKIEYRDEVKPMPKDYGIGGCSFATFKHSGKEGGAEIVFSKPAEGMDSAWQRINYLSNLPRVLAHEFGHSIDPRIVDQKDLSPGMQMRMILEWKDVRKQEPEFSTYVQRIKNPDAREEQVIRDRESFAESCAAFLEDPHFFRAICPERGRFFDFWMKTRFPGMDFIDDWKKQAERHQKIYSFEPEVFSAENAKHKEKYKGKA